MKVCADKSHRRCSCEQREAAYTRIYMLHLHIQSSLMGNSGTDLHLLASSALAVAVFPRGWFWWKRQKTGRRGGRSGEDGRMVEVTPSVLNPAARSGTMNWTGRNDPLSIRGLVLCCHTRKKGLIPYHIFARYFSSKCRSLFKGLFL